MHAVQTRMAPISTPPYHVCRYCRTNIPPTMDRTHWAKRFSPFSFCLLSTYFLFRFFQPSYNIQRGVIWATTARSHRWFGVTGHRTVWTRDYCMYDLFPITDAAEITNHMIDKGRHVTLSLVTLVTACSDHQDRTFCFLFQLWFSTSLHHH